MATPKTITSANAQFLLTVLPILPVPFKIEGYASDAAFLFDTVDASETVMGVDGKMSAGFTPYITPQTITLQADSPSISIFEDWLAAENAAKELFFANASLALPGVKKSYVMLKGALKRVTQAPPAGKVLQPQTFQIDWESVVGSPLVL